MNENVKTDGEREKNCAKCGAINPGEANFCRKCGNKFEAKTQGEAQIKPTIPKEFLVKKDGKNAISTKDFLRLSKTMSLEEITEALKNSLEEVSPVETNKTEGAVENNLTTNKSEKKKESLEDQKKSSIEDFLKILKSQEILVGEFLKDQKEKLVEETTREIEEAADSDFVDLAMAKGMKKGLEMMKAKKIENLTKKIKNET